VNVTTDFGPSDILSIQNTQITMTGETNDILLKAQVTTDSNDDASMPATHYIRIGQPKIYSTGNHVFLVGDSSAVITENIIIKDSDTAPIINPDKNIIIEIPSAITLEWDSAIESNPSTISISSNISSTNLNNLSYDVSNDKKYLTVNISEDLTAGDSLIFSNVFLIVGNTINENSTYKLQLHVNDKKSASDDEDDYSLIITKPSLVFTEENKAIVNDPQLTLSGLEFRENQTYSTVRKDQNIIINLPAEPSDLSWDCQNINFTVTGDNILFTPSCNGSTEKSITLTPTSNFPPGYNIKFNNLLLNIPSTQVPDGDLTYTLRNYQSPISLNSEEDGVSKSFWVASPKTYSESRQSFYLENGTQTVTRIKPIYFIEDDTNPVFGSLATEIWISFPENIAKWNVNNDLMSLNSQTLPYINPVVDFSLDSSTVKISFTQTVSAGDTLVVSGLSIIAKETSSSITEKLQYSLNQGSTINNIDNEIFYIGDIEFTSSDNIIVYKNEFGIHEVSAEIKIIDNSTSSMLDSVQIYLPTEIPIFWSDSL
ncbi:uncharacterized protein METZ01_LOCUS207653, partial [marine metagenome]